MTITVSTDGSALGNPNGPMGWAWADHEAHAGGRPGHEHAGDCDAGGATNGTNQIGELCAVLEALRAHPGSEPLIIETDSQYAINCATTWVRGWKRNGWKNSQKKPVKNAALIKAIDAELTQRRGSVKFVWVKGHAGNAGNEKVDRLARTYAEDCRSKARDGYLPREGWQALAASEYAKGLDIPSDAQLLLDGDISDAEYHLGRSDASDTGTPGTAANHTASTRPADDDAPSESDERTTAMPAPVKPALAALVAEPEGVPDYPFTHSDRARNADSAGASNDDAGQTGDASATTVMPVGADASDDPGDQATTVIRQPRVGGMRRTAEADGTTTLITTPDEIPPASNGSTGRVVSSGTHQTDAGGTGATAENTGDDASNRTGGTRTTGAGRTRIMPQAESGTPAATDGGGTPPESSTTDDAGTGRPPTMAGDASDDRAQPYEQPHNQPHAPTTARTHRGSGLTVSGTLRFSPPPRSSPTYDGRPRLIRGTIAVEGYVQGDGTIVLDDAAFTVHRG